MVSSTVSLNTTLHWFTGLVNNQCSELPLECSTVLMELDPRLPGKVYKEGNVFQLVGDILPKALLCDAGEGPREPVVVFLVCEPGSWVNSSKGHCWVGGDKSWHTHHGIMSQEIHICHQFEACVYHMVMSYIHVVSIIMKLCSVPLSDMTCEVVGWPSEHQRHDVILCGSGAWQPRTIFFKLPSKCCIPEGF